MMETFLCCLAIHDHMERFLSLFFPKDQTPFPEEFVEDIITDILSRLTVKTLLQYKTVCKPWLSLISDPSFAKLQLTHATTARFISAYDHATRKRHFLSAPCGSGPVTHIMTLDNAPTVSRKETTEAEHLNGLVLFTSGNGFIMHNFAYVISPSTRKIFKLPGPAAEPVQAYGKVHICCFFGFDESRNEHKILTVRMLDIRSVTPFKPTRIEIMIFSMLNYTWRTIDVDLPFDVSGDQWYYGTKHGVCVNSVIHVMLQSQNEILAFDLRTEKFSIINIPQDAAPNETEKRYYKKGMNTIKSNQPVLMKNGFLGVVGRDRVEEYEEMDVWILQDYENRVWVKETVHFSEFWLMLDGPFPLNPVLLKEVIVKWWGSCVVIIVPAYEMVTKDMEPIKYTLHHPFLHSNTVRFDHVRSYVESVFPLEMN
ncbi:F-box protein At1g30790-like [Bidens hawaiensis]|uniref:F-box protein At1g30790-like n=1 Tax=Bidens hawaiensis TaxID=980011 RepID=UPI00404B6B85